MNNVSLIGRLVADPELRSTASNVSVCSFRIAVQRPRVKDKTDFINCVAWRNTADFISKYFVKGNKIALVGSLISSSYEGQDGKKHYSTDVLVDNVEFCESKKSDGAKFVEVTEDDGELPF